jgi:mannose-6-phosphate isomerase-like protein (cupin superfamily)
LAAAETNGAYSVVEILSHPGDSTPMHVHQNEDEHFLVLEETARVVRGNDTFDAPAGTTVALPRHIPHAWGSAATSTLRMVVTCWPGGVEAIAVDRTRRRHRRESPRNEILYPQCWSAAAWWISD